MTAKKDGRADYGSGSVKPVIDKATGKQKIDSDGKRVWRVRVDYSANEQGKRAWATKTVHGSKAEANKVRQKMLDERSKGIRAASTMTFAEYADIWQANREKLYSLGERSKRDIDYALRKLKAQIGDFPLKKIKKHTIETAYAAIMQDIADKGHSGVTSVRKCHVYLKQILNDAVENDYITKNPMGSLKPPKLPEPERRSLTVEEMNDLRDKVTRSLADTIAAFEEKEERRAYRMGIGRNKGKACIRKEAWGMSDIGYHVAVRIALATGMRLGEVLGLTWGYVDFETCTISVRQTLTETRKVKEPKTSAGKRDMKIDLDTCELLRRWCVMQAGIIGTLGLEQSAETPVCCSNTSTFACIAHFERWWKNWKQEHGFEGLKFHELRHTQATQLLAHGVDVKTVQARLGHASASLTLNWYAHALPENDERAATLIGSLMGEAGAPEALQTRTAEASLPEVRIETNVTNM